MARSVRKAPDRTRSVFRSRLDRGLVIVRGIEYDSPISGLFFLLPLNLRCRGAFLEDDLGEKAVLSDDALLDEQAEGCDGGAG